MKDYINKKNTIPLIEDTEIELPGPDVQGIDDLGKINRKCGWPGDQEGGCGCAVDEQTGGCGCVSNEHKGGCGCVEKHDMIAVKHVLKMFKRPVHDY